MLDIQFNPCEGDVLRLWTATASLRRQHSQPKRTKASPPPPKTSLIPYILALEKTPNQYL